MSKPENKRVAALGFFDGVHLGHAALLCRVLSISEKTGLTPSVITFDIHPQSQITSENIKLINSLEDKLGLIERNFGMSGLNDVICMEFTEEIASMPWDEFIDRLVTEYDVRHFVVGSNFRFGRGAQGNSKLLEEKCLDSGLTCDIISDVAYDNIVCSSTYIRGLLQSGNIELANTFLGHKHVLTDVVRSGQHFGRTIDAPTINMHFADDVLVPAFGVYAVKVYIGDNKVYNGVTNIGVRPTVDDSGKVTAETHIFDWSETLYDSKVRLEFCKYLRPEKKFKSVDELKEQIKKDCLNAKNY